MSPTMTGWGPFHRRSPQRFTLGQLGDVFLTACSLVLLVVAASMDWILKICLNNVLLVTVNRGPNRVGFLLPSPEDRNRYSFWNSWWQWTKAINSLILTSRIICLLVWLWYKDALWAFSYPHMCETLLCYMHITSTMAKSFQCDVARQMLTDK
jgi:hypothetical protein